MDFSTIKLERHENLALLLLNRPEKLNAFTFLMMEELICAFDLIEKDDTFNAVIISGKGRGFCAGADLRREESESNVPKLEGSDDISLMLRHLYKPVICKIQGSVLAGALLMVTNSTHAVAVQEAKFSAPEILRGLWPHMVMAG